MVFFLSCALLKSDDPPCADHVWYVDLDGDGAGSPGATAAGCEGPEGYVPRPDDCNDEDPLVHPRAAEDCAAVDRNCDGDPDQGAVDEVSWPRDNDGDGWGGSGVAYGCSPPAGAVEDGGDCDDRDPAIHPDAVEVCDDRDVDEDCDGLADDEDRDAHGNGPVGELETWPDADGDGRGDARARSSATCDPVAGRAENADDCDDTDATRPRVYYEDLDRDFYGGPSTSTWTCWQPQGFAGNARDCDDANGDVNPGASERCSTDVDDDCDREINEASAIGCRAWYVDGDGDGFGAESACLCDAADPYLAASGGDCDDADPGIHPAAADVCGDDIDGDCDGFRGCLVEVAAAHVVGVLTAEELGSVVGAGGDLDGDGGLDFVAARTDGLPGLAAWSGTIPANPALEDAFLRIQGASVRDEFGAALTLDADLDVDGYRDLVVGAPGGLLGRPGDVHLFLGPLAGDLAEADADKRAFGEDGDRFGAALASRRDSSGDGTGDVTGDGLPDLVAGAPWASEVAPSAGAVALISGGAWPGSRLLADVSLAGAAEDDNFGAAVLLPGDLDGDGVGDLVVSAPGYDGFEANGGMVCVYAGPVVSGLSYGDCAGMYGGDRSSVIGEVLAAPGDATGDGAPDLVVGQPGDASVVVVAGPFTWGSADTVPFATILGSGSSFGAAVSGGDLDGNGVVEVIVGDPLDQTLAFAGGSVLVLDVSAGGTLASTDALAVFASSEVGAGMGRSLADPVDLDGDACVDLLMGSSTADSSAVNGGALWLAPACALW